MCEIPKNFITSDLVNHLRCDKLSFRPGQEPVEKIDPKKKRTHPRFMFVFADGDLHTAAHILSERLQEPFKELHIACVAVEQKVQDEFIELVRHQFHQLKPHVATNPCFERSLKELDLGGIKFVVAPDENAPAIASPVIVTDRVTQLFFSCRPSGVVILKPFTTIEEAGEIFIREQPQFEAVYVFSELIANVYVLAKMITCVQFFVNCIDICMLPILSYYSLRQPCARLHNGYHYETLELGNIWRIIVFPYVTSFVRRCSCQPGRCTCVIDRTVCS